MLDSQPCAVRLIYYHIIPPFGGMLCKSDKPSIIIIIIIIPPFVASAVGGLGFEFYVFRVSGLLLLLLLLY